MQNDEKCIIFLELYMPSLQVRELPESIYQKLKQEAKLEHRTLSQQAIITLARGLNMTIGPVDRRKKVLEKINKSLQNIDVPFSDPVELVREDRER
jgi:hypothetical protein